MLNYVVMEREVFQTLKASPCSTGSLLCVFLFLLYNRNVETNCTRFIETSEIATFCEMSVRHTNRMLKELVRLDLILCFQSRLGAKMWHLVHLTRAMESAEKQAIAEESLKAQVDALEKKFFEGGTY